MATPAGWLRISVLENLNLIISSRRTVQREHQSDLSVCLSVMEDPQRIICFNNIFFNFLFIKLFILLNWLSSATANASLILRQNTSLNNPI